MPSLPSSGPLSIGTISSFLSNNGCIGYETYSLRNLSVAAGKSTPDGISEFYGYTCGGGPVCNSAGFCYNSTNCASACYPSGPCIDQALFWVGTLTVGSTLYTSCASGPVPAGYYVNSGTCYTVNSSGVVTAVNACPTCNSGTFQFGYNDIQAKCSPISIITLYWIGTLQAGSVVKTNGCAGLSGLVENGYYYGPGGLSVPSMWTIMGYTVDGPLLDPICIPPVECYVYQVGGSKGDSWLFYWTDCCGDEQSAYFSAGATFCAQVDSIKAEEGASYIQLEESCTC